MVTAILLLLLIFNALLLFVIFSAFWGFLTTRVPFVPTRSEYVRSLVVNMAISPSDVVYELGSGNGRVAFLIEELTGAKVIGYEATLWTHLWARAKKRAKRSQSLFVRGNFFRHDWSPATVVYCYLYPPLMRRIGEKALAECRPGTRIVSLDFPIPNLRQTAEFKPRPGHTMYIYEI